MKYGSSALQVYAYGRHNAKFGLDFGHRAAQEAAGVWWLHTS